MDSAVSRKNKNQTEVFHAKDPSFAKANDGFSDEGIHQVIHEIVDDKEDGNFLDTEIKNLHQQEDCERDENLSSGSGNKCKCVV